MSSCQRIARPLVRSLRPPTPLSLCRASPLARRQPLSTTASRRDDGETTTTSDASTPAALPPSIDIEAQKSKDEWFRRMMDPNTTTIRWAEEKLKKQGTPPIGSRRRRAAVRTTGSIPFEHLPYQCFQEARTVLQADRQLKLAAIQEKLEKIRRLEAMDPGTLPGGKVQKHHKLRGLRQELEKLKILADINDPLVKRRFEDGQGDMTKPIYRYLARHKWEAMDRKIIMQRIEQFNIVPDLLPELCPIMDVKLFFRGRKLPPGQIVDSRVSELPPSLHMEVYDAGSRLLTVAVIDSDVPDPANDAFGTRLHFLATNIAWDPTKCALPLMDLGCASAAGPTTTTTTTPTTDSAQHVQPAVLFPWLPPFAQKGAPYHRISVFVLRHEVPLDVGAFQQRFEAAGRDGFTLARLLDRRSGLFPAGTSGLHPVGFNMFRAVWDEHTEEVMRRHGLEGADVEFRPQRVHSLKPPRKARGWEAKRQKAKYKHLWKYTKRIGFGTGGT